MSQEKIQPPRRQRQKHSENDVREFKCPCGKAYLSYPALYTHVRTKHDGKPPGDISKPKNEKTRGRPRAIIVQTTLEDSQSPFDIAEELLNLLPQDNIVGDQGSFSKSEGHTTCEDMASQLLQELSSLDASRLNTVKCYLNQLKKFSEKKYGGKYWSESSPEEMIEVANEFQQNHRQEKQKSPIPKSIFIELTYLLFKWMNRKGWTSHILVKRTANTSSDE